MKKSIIFAGISLLAFTPVTFASNGSLSFTNSELSSVINSEKADESALKYVSSADPNLIATELGALKKIAKSTEQIAADDSKIIEALFVETAKITPIKKAKKTSTKRYKKALKN